MVPKRWRDGDIFGVYAILYGVTRLFTESIRVDRAHIGPLPGAYWASMLFILAGLFLILRNRRLPAPNYTLPTPPSDLETTRAAAPAAAAAVADATRPHRAAPPTMTTIDTPPPGITASAPATAAASPREMTMPPPVRRPPTSAPAMTTRTTARP